MRWGRCLLSETICGYRNASSLTWAPLKHPKEIPCCQRRWKDNQWKLFKIKCKIKVEEGRSNKQFGSKGYVWWLAQCFLIGNTTQYTEVVLYKQLKSSIIRIMWEELYELGNVKSDLLIYTDINWYRVFHYWNADEGEKITHDSYSYRLRDNIKIWNNILLKSWGNKRVNTE